MSRVDMRYVPEARARTEVKRMGDNESRRPAGAAKTAVVTGASSGIGEASARALAAAGFQVILGARRLARIQQLAAEIDAGSRAAAAAGPQGAPRAAAFALDVTDPASIAAFATSAIGAIGAIGAAGGVAGAAPGGALHLLVNNAGGAHGLDPIAQARDEDWQTMWEVNVMGLMRVTRALLPALLASGDGQIINVGSVAGFETYVGGGGYTAAKHAVRAITRTLRLELLGKPVRVTELDPGLADTEFSQVRFGGDEERARAVYRGLTPLTGADVAECVVWAATRPSHVNIDEIVVRPRDQATAHHLHRRPAESGQPPAGAAGGTGGAK
jgi:NADP-dependent 3-hydroxy acid dehydrogenase YdfG